MRGKLQLAVFRVRILNFDISLSEMKKRATLQSGGQHTLAR
jgi:hypothetical protein